MGGYQKALNLIALKHMKDRSTFLDTNILLYFLSEDETKSVRSENTIAAGGFISVQVSMNLQVWPGES